jgi:hypothetical protein
MSRRSGGAIAKHDPAALDQLRVIAGLWDDLIRIPVIGRRIGLDAMIGLVPGVGDAAAAVVASWAVVVAVRLGAPASVLVRMIGNIALDTIVGAIPLLGDLFDMGWRAQRRNVQLLERWFATPHAVQRSSRVVLLAIGATAVGMVAGACWLAVMMVQAMIQAVS